MDHDEQFEEPSGHDATHAVLQDRPDGGQALPDEGLLRLRRDELRSYSRNVGRDLGERVRCLFRLQLGPLGIELVQEPAGAPRTA
jgi:hypothetical protein